ncbi:hypothetical protein KQI68_00430 [Peptoniphilus sp. MSJ-1]|uniref:Uncharacterized protein n=1 Tax=Peptoniphilus ovalis TaxID=2841503 RepID=A0ABS6FG99_9FIRM|nr:hypothetical protein [Peptoniphilus ovalis]MBU5668296.1 hypothetical protein [Peptoniphilus ovalis]
MDKSYLRFLVSELIFIKEDTLINLIPETRTRYNELFGDLEHFVDDLNLNIRMLRRKIDLVKKNSLEEVEAKILNEFGDSKEEKREKEIVNLIEVDDERKRNAEDIFREIIFRFSPELNDFSESKFEEARLYFSSYDVDSLLEFLGRDKPKIIEFTEDELQDLRDALEEELSYYYGRFPLNQLDLLEDKDAIDFNLNRLKNVYEEYEEIYGSLQEELNIKIAEK